MKVYWRQSYSSSKSFLWVRNSGHKMQLLNYIARHDWVVFWLSRSRGEIYSIMYLENFPIFNRALYWMGQREIFWHFWKSFPNFQEFQKWFSKRNARYFRVITKGLQLTNKLKRISSCILGSVKESCAGRVC